jgi:tetratricopeptide (TPR) repeat protein
MKSKHFAFARRTAFLLLTACAVVPAAVTFPQVAMAQDARLMGTWNFVPQRSNFMPGPARYKSAKLTFSAAGEAVLEGTGADDKPVKVTYSEVLDGKPHPVAGMSDYDASALTKINDNSVSYIYTRRRNTVIVGSRFLSADGNTLTYSEKSYDARGKELSSATMVFAKPGFEMASATPAPAAAPAQQQQAAVITGGPTPDEAAASAALEKGDDDEAIRLFTKAISGPPTPQLYFDYVSRGIAYAKKGQNDLALADFDAAVKAKPDDADARFRRGSMRLTLKQYDAAIEDLTAVVGMDGTNAMAYRLRGFAYNTLGKDTLAAPDYDKACMLNKDLCM